MAVIAPGIDDPDDPMQVNGHYLLGELTWDWDPSHSTHSYHMRMDGAISRFPPDLLDVVYAGWWPDHSLESKKLFFKDFLRNLPISFCVCVVEFIFMSYCTHFICTFKFSFTELLTNVHWTNHGFC